MNIYVGHLVDFDILILMAAGAKSYNSKVDCCQRISEFSKTFWLNLYSIISFVLKSISLPLQSWHY